MRESTSFPGGIGPGNEVVREHKAGSADKTLRDLLITFLLNRLFNRSDEGLTHARSALRIPVRLPQFTSFPLIKSNSCIHTSGRAYD